MEIRKAAVIGAGVMGGGIAAQIANAGIPVVLLDRAAEGRNRRAIVEGALDRLLKAEPAAFMSKANARRITLGTVEDDFHLIGDADWIVEVVLEDRAVKRALYDKLEGARKAGSIVSSNTSTIPLAELTQGMPERFRRDFLITHFFNPPRYMRLLEIVAGPDTRPEALNNMVTDLVDMSERQPRTQAASFSLERQLPSMMVATAGVYHHDGKNMLVGSDGINVNGIHLDNLAYRAALRDLRLHAAGDAAADAVADAAAVGVLRRLLAAPAAAGHLADGLSCLAAHGAHRFAEAYRAPAAAAASLFRISSKNSPAALRVKVSAAIRSGRTPRASRATKRPVSA